MAFYSPQEKKDFILKDVKNAIGMGVGNAFTKAVDVVVSKGILPGYTSEMMVKDIIELRNEFFTSNQEKIQEEYQKWLKENEDGLDMTLGLGVKDNPEPL